MATRTPKTRDNQARLRRFSEETERQLQDIQRAVDLIRDREKARLDLVPNETVFTIDPESVPDNTTNAVLIPAFNTLVEQFDRLRTAYLASIQGLISAELGELRRRN